jgi:sensor domain CHASE-containing protein
MPRRSSTHHYGHGHARGNLNPLLARVLSANIREQLNEQVIVLLGAAPLAIVSRGVLESDPLERRFRR